MFSLQPPRHISTLPDRRCLRDVRFPPDPDQIADVSTLRFRATFGLMRRSEQHSYSITSSVLG